MSDFLSSMVKMSGNKYASLVSDGLDGSDVAGFVDTGCYMLNGLLSASIYNGMPNNKITALAGESSTGKTYIALGIVSKFLRDNPDAVVLYFDVGERMCAATIAHEQRVTLRKVAGVRCVLINLHQAAVAVLALSGADTF